MQMDLAAPQPWVPDWSSRWRRGVSPTGSGSFRVTGRLRAYADSLSAADMDVVSCWLTRERRTTARAERRVACANPCPSSSPLAALRVDRHAVWFVCVCAMYRYRRASRYESVAESLANSNAKRSEDGRKRFN